MRLFFWKKERPTDQKVELNHLLQLAQANDQAARESLIQRYTPFIVKTASQVIGRYLRVGEDDEISVAMLAFNEAIDTFHVGKGAGFLTFAEMVIKRRLIDYLRKQSSMQREIPFTSLEQGDEEGEVGATLIETRQSLCLHVLNNEAEARREEIAHFRCLLGQFGISLSELVEICPKHDDARKRAMEVAKLIAHNPTYARHLREKKQLPMRALEQEVSMSRKTLERQRKYIIAVALILLEDLAYLKEYIHL